MSDDTPSRWRYGKPPHLLPVEVEIDGQVVLAKAVWGSDGMRPHWVVLTDEHAGLYAPSAFRKWRLVSRGGA